MNKRWAKRKTKFLNIKHPLLAKLPKRLDTIYIQNLLPKVRQGEADACQKMVEEHMYLVKLKVWDFLSDYPFLTKELDELVSVAMLACVEAVDRVKKGSMKDHDNITGYIRVAIWRFLGEWVGTYLLDATVQESLQNEDNYLDLFNGRMLEIIDILKSLTLVDEEWYIIESRMLGDTNEEIAEHLNVTEFTVRFILGDIYSRFLEIYEFENV